jgi:hypothetical protein
MFTENDPLQTAAVEETVFHVQNDDRPRYVLCAVESPNVPGLHVDSKAVQNGLIQFCKITPIQGYDKWAQFAEIPEGQALPWKTSGDQTVGAYRIFAAPEFNSIMERYGKWGIAEIDSEDIKFRPVREVAGLALNEKIFGNLAFDRLLSNSEGSVQDAIRANVLKWSEKEPAKAKMYKSIEASALKALRAADRFYRDRLEETHRGFEVPPSDPKFKSLYDELDRLALRRTGVEARHSAIDRLNTEKQAVNVTVAAPEQSEETKTLLAAVLKLLQEKKPDLEIPNVNSGGDDKPHQAKAGRPSSGKA